VYNNNLELLWKGENGQTGHFPHMLDLDGSGYDTMAIGYSLWDHTGRQLWSHDKEFEDHADGIAIVNMSPDPTSAPRVYACGSDEGFIMFDIQGKVLKARADRACAESGDRQVPDGRGGAATADGQLLAQSGDHQHFRLGWKPGGAGGADPHGEPAAAVNWKGDGQEYVLLSGNVREGGMVDGHLRRVVMFPDDGHPDLAAYTADLTGDQRDEVILWTRIGSGFTRRTGHSTEQRSTRRTATRTTTSRLPDSSVAAKVGSGAGAIRL